MMFFSSNIWHFSIQYLPACLTLNTLLLFLFEKLLLCVTCAAIYKIRLSQFAYVTKMHKLWTMSDCVHFKFIWIYVANNETNWSVFNFRELDLPFSMFSNQIFIKRQKLSLSLSIPCLKTSPLKGNDKMFPLCSRPKRIFWDNDESMRDKKFSVGKRHKTHTYNIKFENPFLNIHNNMPYRMRYCKRLF